MELTTVSGAKTVTKSSTRLAFVGSHALGGVSTISKSHRKSLDGSFSVLGASSSGLPAPRSSLRRDHGCWSPANGVCNSTPLSNDDDGDEDSRFGLRCSNVASPILRATNSSSSGEPSLGGIGGVGDAQRDSAIDAAHNLQGSQLSKELVFSHSYIPKSFRPTRTTISSTSSWAFSPSTISFRPSPFRDPSSSAFCPAFCSLFRWPAFSSRSAPPSVPPFATYSALSLGNLS